MLFVTVNLYVVNQTVLDACTRNLCSNSYSKGSKTQLILILKVYFTLFMQNWMPATHNP